MTGTDAPTPPPHHLGAGVGVQAALADGLCLVLLLELLVEPHVELRNLLDQVVDDRLGVVLAVLHWLRRRVLSSPGGTSCSILVSSFLAGWAS